MVNAELTQLNGVEGLIKNPDNLEMLSENDVLCIGMGTNTEAVPWRVLSYLVPSYEMLLANPELKLDIYIAEEFSSLNGLTPEQSNNASQKMRNNILEFTEIIAPELCERIRFVETTGLNAIQEGYIESFTDVLEADEKIKEFGDKYNGRDSIRYLAAHSLYMRDQLDIPDDAFLVRSVQGENTVMVVGQQEAITTRSRQIIIDNFGKPGASIRQIETNVGRIPPYSASRFDEPMLDSPDWLSIDNLLSAPPEIYRDLGALLTFMNRRMYQAEEGYIELFGKGSAKDEKRREFVMREQNLANLLLLQDILSTSNE